jgi:hypothetical protein
MLNSSAQTELGDLSRAARNRFPKAYATQRSIMFVIDRAVYGLPLLAASLAAISREIAKVGFVRRPRPP